MAASVFVDTLLFFVHLFSQNVESMNQSFRAEQLTMEEFTIMQTLLSKIEKAHRKNSDEQTVNVKEVLGVFRTVLKIEDAIRSMLFDHEKGTKTLGIIQTYNRIKMILLNCAT